jgi:hypothetical protein
MPSKSAQKSASIPLPPSLRARTTESQKHPGAPDKARPRRSTQEVQAEKAAKEKAILDEQKKREDAIAETARIEKELDEQHQEKLRNANHPPPTAQKKVVHPRAAKTASAMQGITIFLSKFHSLPEKSPQIQQKYQILVAIVVMST